MNHKNIYILPENSQNSLVSTSELCIIIMKLDYFVRKSLEKMDTITTLVSNLHNWNSFLLCEK